MEKAGQRQLDRIDLPRDEFQHHLHGTERDSCNQDKKISFFHVKCLPLQAHVSLFFDYSTAGPEKEPKLRADTETAGPGAM